MPRQSRLEIEHGETYRFGKRLLDETTTESLDTILREVKRRRGTEPNGHIPTCPLGIEVLDDMLSIFHRPPQPREGVPDRHKVLEITSPGYGTHGKTSLLYYIAAVGILPASYDGVELGGRDGAVVFLDSDDHFDANRLREVAMNYVRGKMWMLRKLASEKEMQTERTQLQEPEHQDAELETDHQEADQPKTNQQETDQRETEQQKTRKQEAEHIEQQREAEQEEAEKAAMAESTGAIPQKRKQKDETALRKMVEDCMRHVHVFKPKSSESLLATLLTVEEYLLDTTRHGSANRHIHSIMLDSASTFYWQDKRQAFIDSLPTEVPKFIYAVPPPLQEIVHSAPKIVRCLRQLQDRFACTVIFTVLGERRADLHRPKKGGFGTPLAELYVRPKIMSFIPHLPFAWRTYATVRLVVRRDKVRRYPVGQIKKTLGEDSEALKRIHQRQDIVSQGRISAWIDPYLKEEWPSWVLPAIRALKGGGRFVYFTNKYGVTLRE